jgi:hypothetical protein
MSASAPADRKTLEERAQMSDIERLPTLPSVNHS